jgi:TPR repeat protein
MRRGTVVALLVIAGCGTKEKVAETVDGGSASRGNPPAAVLVDAGEDVQVYAQLSTMCDRGDLDRCLDVATMILGRADSTRLDRAHAETVLLQACEQGRHKESCGTLGEQYHDGTLPGGKDEARATHYERLACDLGQHTSCSLVELRYMRGIGTAVDMDAARTIFDRECDAGRQGACYGMMKYVQDGTFPPKGERDLAFYRRRVCALGGEAFCDHKE